MGSFSLVVAASLLVGGANVGAVASNLESTSEIESTSVSLAATDIPAKFKPSVEWVWKNRIVKEGSTNRKNLIFDQIYAGKGTLNYVVRWQSPKNLTLQQRKDMASMLSRQVNNWNKQLKGYDGWPYDNITVKIVGWAVANPSQILNKQSNEIVYTDTITDDLSKSNPSIPAKLPVAPDALSRFEHFSIPTMHIPADWTSGLICICGEQLISAVGPVVTGDNVCLMIIS